MMNPTFLRLDTQDGEMRLDMFRLDRSDARTLEDTGLSEADLARAEGAGRTRALFGAVLRVVRQALARGTSGLATGDVPRSGTAG